MKLKKKAIIASLITLIPSLIGLLALYLYDDSITESLGNEMWKSPALLAVCLPIVIFILNIICTIFTFKDNKNAQNPKVLNMVLWICPFISIFSSISLWALIMGKDFDFYTLMPIILGLSFILLGNYLPKCTRNRTIGIKIKWTLANEENWTATHRFGGKAWVICGVLFALSALLKSSAVIISILVLVLIFSMLPVLYSFLYYKKQVKEGTWIEKEDLKLSKKASVAVAIIVSIILIFCAVITFTGEIKISCEDSLVIEADYWSDIEIKYDDIENIEYRENVPGERISGFGSHRLLLGYFKNDEFKTYTRYTYAKCDSCIVITTKGEKIVINLKTEEETKNLFQALSEKKK
ncbi:MAG: hypothetical protein E7614_08720 [Ruminococcaceae bacterium]|nr:hypothetical protein [Oscillospiraceae bacterium]